MRSDVRCHPGLDGMGCLGDLGSVQGQDYAQTAISCAPKSSSSYLFFVLALQTHTPPHHPPPHSIPLCHTYMHTQSC